MPYKKFRLLYEWIEDEIDHNRSILVSEVRYQTGALVGEDFGKYQKFEKLSERVKKFLNLKAVAKDGEVKKWISAA